MKAFMSRPVEDAGRAFALGYWPVGTFPITESLAVDEARRILAETEQAPDDDLFPTADYVPLPCYHVSSIGMFGDAGHALAESLARFIAEPSL